MKTLVAITVVGTVDSCARMDELKEFAKDALSTWGESFHPDDPLFDSVEVQQVRVIKIGRIEA